MKLNTWIPVGLAVVLGLAAAFVAKSVVSKRNKGEDSNQVKVVVVKENVAPGSPIKPTDLGISAFAGESKPDGAFADPNVLIGRVSLSPLVRGQVVVETLLAPSGAAPGVQNLVPVGMRLITVEVNEFSSLAGMLAPGCRVDILAALSDPETHEMMARTIVENIQIRAVGQRVNPGGAEPTKPEDQQAGFRSVTLLVTPKEAEAIHVAGTAGRPWLVLRGTGDNGIANTDGVRFADLRGNNRDHGQSAKTQLEWETAHSSKSNPATTQPAVKTRTVTFIKGTKVETLTVDEGSAPPPFQGTLTNVDTAPISKTIEKKTESKPVFETSTDQTPAIPENYNGIDD